MNTRMLMILSTAVAAAAAVYTTRRSRVRGSAQEQNLDTALADTFPASDPLPFSATQPAKPAPSMRS